MPDVFVVSAVRTAIGSFGGSLRDQAPGQLGALVTREALRRATVDPTRVGHAIFGQVIPSEPKDAYLARVVAVNAGIPHATPAMTVNRLCGSGLQAILSAAQSILLGDCDLAVAGGVEVMSRAPFFGTGIRWGTRMGDSVLIDALNGALTDPFGNGLMGVTAENVASRFGISRDLQDQTALESHRRAAAAIAAGRFAEQIVSVSIRSKGKEVPFCVDEHLRVDLKIEDLTKLAPLFKKAGTVTAGNASGINDGASAVVISSGETASREGFRPLARLVSYAHAGVDPALMGIGPVPATRLALQRAGLQISDLDVIESNEAFAAQACAVAQELGFDPARVNINGSGISLGHPVGATGAILVTKLVYELARSGGRYGLVTMCIGGGQGIAAIFERSG